MLADTELRLLDFLALRSATRSTWTRRCSRRAGGFPPFANFLTFDADPGLSFMLDRHRGVRPSNLLRAGSARSTPFQTFNSTTAFDTTVR